MNALLQVLRIPWYAAHRSLRWVMLFVFLTFNAGAIASGLLLPDKPGRWKLSVICFCIGQVLLWMAFAPHALRLAIATRQLRVPGIQRQILRSLLLYGVLSVSVPTIWLAVHGAPIGPPAMLLTLCACAGLAFATLPGYLIVLLGLLPGLFAALHPYLPLRDISDPTTVFLMGLAAIALLVISAWRARRLLLDDAGRGASLLMVGFGSGGSGQLITREAQLLRQRADWLRASPDIAHAGPSRPNNAIRMALGSFYVPLTWMGYGKRVVLSAVPMALPLLLLAVVGTLGDHSTGVMAAFWNGGLIGGVGTLLTMAGPLIGALSVSVVRTRWQRTSAELPLLALLPKLGDARGMRAALLRAGLGMPLLMHVLVALLAGAVVLFSQQHAREFSFFLLAQLGTATITGALLVNIFGGRALAIWSSAMLLGLGWVLTMFSLTLPLMAWRRDHPVAWAGELLLPLGLVWLLLALAMLGLARRGWLGLQQLPHPFLAH